MSAWLRRLEGIDARWQYARSLLFTQIENNKWWLEAYNICGVKSQWNPESMEAWEQGKGTQVTRFVDITRLATLAWERGITTNEVATRRQLPDNQISPTMSYLKAMGVLVATRRRRLTAKNRPARVLVLKGLEEAYQNVEYDDEDIYTPKKKEEIDPEYFDDEFAVYDEDGDPVI